MSDPARFVGRRAELDALSRQFRGGARVGFIVGDAGVGKTSLARVFSALNRDLFPGGISFNSAARFVAMRTFGGDGRPHLSIIDDAELLTPDGLDSLQEDIADSDALRFLVVGRRQPRISTPSSFTVRLSSLGRDDVAKLLSDVDPKFEPGRIAALFGDNPYAVLASLEALQRGVTWDELLASLHDFSFPGILDASGAPFSNLRLQRSPIVLDIKDVNAQILETLQVRPADWWQLSPRKFEEVVAEILTRQGYFVQLTPESDDGGFDIYAAKKDGLGEFLYLVECKRYVPPHKVGVHVVRALNGSLAAERASGAAVVTTSYFTHGAAAYQSKFAKTLKLHDYVALQRWLAELQSRWPRGPTPHSS